MDFNCTKCGACCRVANPFTGMGRCPKLTEGGLCSIYETRPQLCRVDFMADLNGIPRAAYYKETENACKSLQAMEAI